MFFSCNFCKSSEAPLAPFPLSSIDEYWKLKTKVKQQKRTIQNRLQELCGQTFHITNVINSIRHRITAVDHIKLPDGSQRSRFNLIRVATFPQTQQPFSPHQYARIGHVLHHLSVPKFLSSFQHRKRSPVREPPRVSFRVVLFFLSLSLHVPSHELNLLIRLKHKGPKVTMAIKRVHRRAMVVREYSWSGQVVSSGWKVRRNRAVNDSECHRLCRLRSLWHEEKLVVPKCSDGVFNDVVLRGF